MFQTRPELDESDVFFINDLPHIDKSISHTTQSSVDANSCQLCDFFEAKICICLRITTSFCSGGKSSMSCRTFEKVSSLIIVVSILDRKSTRLNSSHVAISYAVF